MRMHALFKKDWSFKNYNFLEGIMVKGKEHFNSCKDLMFRFISLETNLPHTF